MKISQKLLVIVSLTVLEVSITIWAAFQISKGASLHKLNFLHLKHNATFQNEVLRTESSVEVPTDDLREAVLAIREQPVQAAALVCGLDRFMMERIGTDQAINLIKKDLLDADNALKAISDYENGEIDYEHLIAAMHRASDKFNRNSSLFEEPVDQTVSFTLKTMIPMILFISLFNIAFISYLSKSISSSIKRLIDLLRRGDLAGENGPLLESQVGGELGELMVVAEGRLRSELMNIETNEELRQLIDERTESLESARNEAQASLAAKERFLANMSHEIRTPINGILCAAELVSQDLDPEDPHFEFNSIIHQSANSLLRILNDILDTSKIEAGQVSLETTAFDLASTMEHVAALMRPQAEAKGLCFVLNSDCSRSDQCVKGDPTRLRQILINLIGNALKFTEQGQVSLDAKLVSKGGRNRELRIKVRDTGIGMSEAQVARLFDRFVQADDSTTRKYGGTGLGLALSRDLARLMGGDISVSSSPGEGAEFTLMVPFAICDSPDDAPKEDPGTSRDYAGSTVLLVEDNKVNQKVASKVLDRMGLEVIVAENGAVALDLVGPSVSLVLMDIQMPVMDGVEATLELRARGCTLPIIALTANVFEEDRKRYVEAGMSGFLAKPIQMPELVSILDRHLASELGVVA